MKKQSLLAVLFVLATLSANAQQQFVWNQYKIAMTLHDDFKVTKNTDTEFRASGVGMEVYVDVWENKNVSLDNMDEALIAYANSSKMDNLDTAHEVHINGLEGYYIEGERNGDRIMIVGLIDPNSHTNFVVEINFDDTDKNAERDALEIMNSVKRLR